MAGFNFRRVSGNLAGVALASAVQTLPELVVTATRIRSPNDRNFTPNLSYPLNVENDPQQGHYIIFEIMKQNKAKLKARKEKIDEIFARGFDILDIKNFSDLSDEAQRLLSAGAEKYNATNNKQSGPNSLQVAQNATTKMDAHIALYMPPSVQVSYGAKYGETDIGVMAETANAAIREFMNTKGDLAQGAAELAGAAVGGVQQGAWNWFKSKLPAGGEAVLAINSGSIITPRMELMFEGIQRRTFTFNFTFIPKSDTEADMVEKIVKLFKKHMSANYGSLGMGGVDGVREMEIPDFFNIKYMHQSHPKHNPHLNLIKQCVLTNTTVEYGADQYKSYAGGRPQTTKLNLSFSELEIITKDYIEQGY